MRDVVVAAVGLVPFGKHPDKSIKDLVAEVVRNLLGESPVAKDQIEAAWMSNAGWGMQTGQHCIRGQVALAPAGIVEIPVMNVENACAGGASAFHGAFLGVASGAYDVALAIGAEKSFVAKGADTEARKKGFESFLAGTDVEATRRMIDDLRAEAKHAGSASGASPAAGSGHSPFMDLYARGARAHMERYGTTQQQIATIAAKNHRHGALNPVAQYRRAMTVEEVLADRPIAYPLTRSMCSPMGDGAAAAILVAGDAVRRFPGIRPVRVRASVLVSSSRTGDQCRRAAERAYAMAGVGPEDVDTAEVHDATAFGELLQTEALGFCKEGEGGRYAESGATALGGARPVNPSGGLECRGHPIGATGLAQIAEIVLQLRGDAGERQVGGARIGLTENGGGFLGAGEAAVAIHVFEAPSGGGAARS